MGECLIMKAKRHGIFFSSQHTVQLDLPNDVFDDLMVLSKQVNSFNKNEYRLDPDDIVCMALEDFTARYSRHIRALLNRVEGTFSLREEDETLPY